MKLKRVTEIIEQLMPFFERHPDAWGREKFKALSICRKILRKLDKCGVITRGDLKLQ